MTFMLLIALFLIGIATYVVGQQKAYQVAGVRLADMHSLPSYHGAHLALWSVVPAFLVLLLWTFASGGLIDSAVVARFSSVTDGLSPLEVNAFLRDVNAIAFGGIVAQETPERVEAASLLASLTTTSTILKTIAVLAAVGAGFFYAWKHVTLRFRARHGVERFLRIVLIGCSAIAILTTVGIVLSLIFESLRFFSKVPFWEFLFGIQWSPQTAIRADQVGSSGAFGAIPLFAGTLLITAIAISVAAPIGLLAAIYLSDYASPAFRSIAKPILEVLAGIPTVVYGFFAALTVAPFFRQTGESVGLTVSSESALAAGLVMGIMIIPFVSSLSDDVINAVPQSLRDGSAGLGATKSETIRRVVLPAALPGIVSALLLAVSRAVGETMIVVMAAGLAANLTVNPLEAVTTVTVQIVTLLVGDQEFDSAKTLAAFALGLVLFCVTLALNVIALRIVQKYREQYD
ncbi:MAG: phosphate ABC transporter permease subunit PstC [Pseudomonadota bacterium]